MPHVPEFGNVYGTRVELALAGGIPDGPSKSNVGGLLPRHRTAVLRYIADMVRYAVAVGCHDDDITEAVGYATAAGQARTQARMDALDRERNRELEAEKK
jgi:hypothetical protein